MDWLNRRRQGELKVNVVTLLLATDELRDAVGYQRLKNHRFPCTKNRFALAELRGRLAHIKAAGRAATFELLNSGISHREFMRFVRSLP
ncbi:hypothetical protein ACQE3D_18360 [Methylomonas sp. MS20]